ncbi:MAG: hypothetical protein RLZZ393_242, partial [Pseudomonadota bacterium]
MLHISGGPAASDFRLAKLLDQLKSLEPSVRGLGARFLHLVEVDGTLTDAELVVLRALLTYGPRHDATDE